MNDVIVEILAELISILALLAKWTKQNRSSMSVLAYIPLD
jgi:hypothetical protein